MRRPPSTVGVDNAKQEDFPARGRGSTSALGQAHMRRNAVFGEKPRGVLTIWVSLESCPQSHCLSVMI